MKTKLKATSIAVLSALFSYSVLAADTGLEIDISDTAKKTVSTSQAKEQPNSISTEVSSEDKEFFNKVLNKADNEGYLSSDEVTKIKNKQHILFKYLYEQEQLENLRNVLGDSKIEEQKADALNKKFPYTLSELKELRQIDSKIAEATNSPVDPVKFKIKTITIDVDAPDPIVVNVAKGYSSSIMFFDQTGNPWPIEGNIIGDGDSFKSYPIEGKEHIGVFEITTRFKESNALINLKDLNVPIVIRLSGSETDIDARISVRIPKFGPESTSMGYSSKSREKTSTMMLNVLNGDKINDAKLYDLEGTNGTAWYKDDYLYIRTRDNLISPPWKESVSSPTGYNVYKVPPVSNLLFTVDGEIRRATIKNSFEVKLKQKQSIFE
ncbi:DotH/IcmK family type IV secretion protein [Psychromonas sp. SP041]|uniref:DotH/IcmK family type IV secretion protein n=1 Tax=Psychromonas sp. SP041 TaxID=1365007 RepID=UPI0010C7ABD3|nr:DotH/IcmK family type IV secretion protein [Psychromonas sp. SP041]